MTSLVVVAASDMHVWRDTAQVVEGLLVADVPSTNDLLDLPWYK